MMRLGIVLAFLGVVQTVFCTEIAGVKTSEQFAHSTVLDTDGNYILFWNFNDTHVTFEVHVKTKGGSVFFCYFKRDQLLKSFKWKTMNFKLL